jgi:hypothetical protein
MMMHSKIEFRDGEKADVTLELMPKRIRLTTRAKGVTNSDVWNRDHVVRLQVDNVREGEWYPTMTLQDGKKVTLGFPLDIGTARELTEAF